MPIKCKTEPRYRYRTFPSGKKVRLGFCGNKVVEAKKYKGKGWFNESQRHSLASRGIKTSKKINKSHNNFLVRIFKPNKKDLERQELIRSVHKKSGISYKDLDQIGNRELRDMDSYLTSKGINKENTNWQDEFDQYNFGYKGLASVGLLKPVYDTRKSFYGKAEVNSDDKGNKILYSYGTKVAEIKDGKVKVYGTYSQTTLRHIKDFLKQEGYKAENGKQIMKDYGDTMLTSSGKVSERIHNFTEGLKKKFEEQRNKPQDPRTFQEKIDDFVERQQEGIRRAKEKHPYMTKLTQEELKGVVELGKIAKKGAKLVGRELTLGITGDYSKKQKEEMRRKEIETRKKLEEQRKISQERIKRIKSRFSKLGKDILGEGEEVKSKFSGLGKEVLGDKRLPKRTSPSLSYTRQIEDPNISDYPTEKIEYGLNSRGERK